MRRLILMVAAVATVTVPSALAVVSLAPIAGASSGTTCGTANGNVSGAITFKKCFFTSAKDKTNKTLTGTFGALAHGGTLVWVPSGQTTVVGAPAFTSPGQGACKSKSTEFIASGMVIGGTSTHTKVGDVLSVRICLKGAKLSLLKGSIAHL